VTGPSRGGPFVGIVDDDLTRALVARGDAVVPRLIARLPASGFDEAVYIVFVLRELRAASAESAIRTLQAELPARSVGHDLTLKMQVDYYLRDLATW
jgi:hypothetical protein